MTHIFTLFGLRLAEAQAPATPPADIGGGTTLADIIDIIILYLNQFLVLLMALAIVMFVVYIIKYFIKADSDKKDAGNYVLYAVIGFFVILSVWGIVNILSNTFGLGNATNSAPAMNDFRNLFPR